MTPLSSSYRSALSTAAKDALVRRSRPQQLPGRTVVVHDHEISAELAARYARMFHRNGPALDTADLPSVLVHVASFPAAMELMADPDFPLPLLGMVHLRNRVVHHAPVPAGTPVEVAASATRLSAHPSGTTVDLVVTVHGPARVDRPAYGTVSDPSDGTGELQLLWEGTSTYLAAGVHLPAHERPAKAGHPPFTAPQLTAQWRLPASTGREYAAVSGDFNPIHLNPVTAKLLGQKGMIAHGMYLAGRMLAGREPAGAGHEWEISFATPVLLPGTVSLGVVHADRRNAEITTELTTEVTAWNGRTGRPHFTGSITVPGSGPGHRSGPGQGRA
ncbi:MaoC/PaaZ C-terminal domain-containing protein [Citricoccus sp. K5]|uniref:MaoC family dehydratase n=1 Tax=Citricoccus sp. K5 TaxID=2653135 RepID=UPI00135B6559|nr:MaoC/PaaZ C-terminal domain-containing protein [Citricoccus sp. K5]